MILTTDNSSHGYRIAEAAGAIFNPDSDQVICRVDGQSLLGGVIYQDFTKASICMHVAGFDPRWINRDMLWVCFDYPFNQLGVSTVFVEIPSRNRKSLEFVGGIGFKELTRIPEVYPGPDGDLVVLRMKREDCRWLDIRHGLQREAA